MRTHHHRIIPASRLLIEERRRTKLVSETLFVTRFRARLLRVLLPFSRVSLFFLSSETDDDALRATDDFDISWWYQSKVLLDGSL